MYRERRILAIVPARGGSKGIARKNLREVGGVPLVGRVGALIPQLRELDRIVISTDDEEIACLAERFGIAAPFRRPTELSGDFIGDLDVLKHGLEAMEAIDGVRYDVVVMLQPTAPLRRAEQVRAALRKAIDENWDAVWTVSPTDSKAHPLKQLTLGKDGALDYYDPAGDHIIARQQLNQVYHRNGVAYAITRECLMEQNTIKGARSAALIIDGPDVSIDTEWDIELANYVIGHEPIAR